MLGRHARRTPWLIALACSLALPALARAQEAEVTAKKVEVATKQAEKKADIYDTKANPRAQIKAALAKAKRDHSRVLVMYGGNWCGWCHKLHDTFKKNAPISRTLLYEYQLVLVDSQNDEIPAIAKEYGAKINGVPYLTVLDEDGKVVCNQPTDPLEEGDHHDPKKVHEFLTKNVAEPVDAEKAVSEALATASSEGKMVFLHFGAPWCGWCHKLEDFMAREDMKAILSQDFVDLKIDQDRMKNAKAVGERFKKNEQGGIPWFAFVDSSGKVLVTSDGPKGNTGYPAEPQEIAHFIDMLKKNAKKMTPDQIAKVESALKEAAAKLNVPRPAAAAAGE